MHLEIKASGKWRKLQAVVAENSHTHLQTLVSSLSLFHYPFCSFLGLRRSALFAFKTPLSLFLQIQPRVAN